MAKCLECALLQCQLQSLLFLQLHQSSQHQVNHDLPCTPHTCHLVDHHHHHQQHQQPANATSTSPDWPLLLANLMIETNNQHLVHHLLASLNQEANIINGNSSFDSSCHANESNGDEVNKVPGNDSNNLHSMRKKDSPINYCDSQGSIKSTSVKSRAFPNSTFHRPNEQTKPLLPSQPVSSSSEKLHTLHHQKSPGHINQVREQNIFSFQPNQIHLSPPNRLTCKRLRPIDLPDSTTNNRSSNLIAIGGKLRKLAESFHLSRNNKFNCIDCTSPS